MCNLVVVLFALNSALVCNSIIINGYNQPAATSFVRRIDEPDLGKTERYGFSKKYGYNKMVFTTYLTPVPEEVSASYSTYVIHPLDHKRCGYAAPQNQPVQDSYAKATEDAQVTNFRRFPIVVADNDDIEESESEQIDEEVEASLPKFTEEDIRNIELKIKKMFGDKDQSGDDYREWFFNGEPFKVNKNPGLAKNKQYVDLYEEWFNKQGPRDITLVADEDKKQFSEWIAKNEPKVAAPEKWKNFKEQFDSLFDEKYRELFGDDDEDEDDDYEDDEEDDEDEDGHEDEDEDDDDKQRLYYKQPIDYEYQDENEDVKKLNDNELQGSAPKSAFKNYDYSYKLSHKW